MCYYNDEVVTLTLTLTLNSHSIHSLTLNIMILVTGGCGYIGCHTIVDLLDNGFDVICADSNIRSNASILEGVEKITGVRVKNYAVDLCDKEASRQIFEENPSIVGIIHFAALKSVPESVDQPLWYFRNNLNSLLTVLELQAEYKVPNFIFSSSCSVYGNTKELPVTEDTAFGEAECPYARTKQIGEQIITDFARKYAKTNTILLRYFNPAGAHESALIGEISYGAAQNLVPVITQTASGKRKELTVFGDDYNTRDGSCIRDYIHVMDLANAHTKAVQYLIAGKQQHNCEVFNLGIGEGVTVLEAINAFEKETGVKLNYKLGPRRPGDVESIYSNYELAASKLGWQPKRNIEDIMRTAWAWTVKQNA